MERNKLFLASHNYREVSCCRNCKSARNYFDEVEEETIYECILADNESVSSCFICDLFEHK